MAATLSGVLRYSLGWIRVCLDVFIPGWWHWWSMLTGRLEIPILDLFRSWRRCRIYKDGKNVTTARPSVWVLTADSTISLRIGSRVSRCITILASGSKKVKPGIVIRIAFRVGRRSGYFHHRKICTAGGGGDCSHHCPACHGYCCRRCRWCWRFLLAAVVVCWAVSIDKSDMCQNTIDIPLRMWGRDLSN